MYLRSIPDSFSIDTVAEIDKVLDSLEAEHAAIILLAVESGSRAWGFPSPDSDYDCRFIYVRKVDRYLSPWPVRDVIETPLERELDVNGWDLGKALKLMLSGNAVVLEWLQSSIVYRGDDRFRSEFIELAYRFADRGLIARHYLHLGEAQRRTYFADTKAIPLKKLFYALRPAAALRWLRLHPNRSVAPMHFPTLMGECDAPTEVRQIVADLLARKAVTRELGTAAMPAPIAAFIDDEFALARSQYERRGTERSAVAKSQADAFFRETAKRFDGAEGTRRLSDSATF